MIPINLHIENFISHSDSVIDFSDFNISLILGMNGVGKSTILDAIRFALFGKTRFNKKERAVRHGQTSAKVDFIFEIDECEYRVVRTLTKKSGIIDVVFYKKVDDEWNSDLLTCDTPKITTSKIEQLIGMSHDTFVNSVYFKQSDIFGLAGVRVGERKNILKEVLQIGIWDTYQDTAKNFEKELANQKVIIDDRLNNIGEIESQLEDLISNQDNTKKQIRDLTYKVSKIKSKKTEIDSFILDLEKTISNKNTDVLEDKLSKINNRLDEIGKSRDLLKNEFENNKNYIANMEAECNDLNDKIINLAYDVVKIDNKGYEKAKLILLKENKSLPDLIFNKKDLDKFNNEIENLNQELSIKSVELTQLDSFEPGDVCPVCLQENHNPDITSKKRITKKAELQDSIESLKGSLSFYKKELKKYNSLLESVSNSLYELDRVESLIIKRQNSILEYNKNNEIIKEKFNSLLKERTSLKNEKSEISDSLTTDDSKLKSNLINAKKNSQELNLEIDNSNKRLLELNMELGNLNAKIEVFENKLSEKQTLLSIQNRLSDDIWVYSKLSKAFGKDGIQAIILENITEDLRNYTNDFLKNICNEPMSVDFITQKKTTTGAWKEDFEIIINTNNECLDFDDLSGGEQVRVAISLRLALSRLLMQRVGCNIKFLLLDEVDQTLDSQGIEILSEALHNLSNEFKILVITHNEQMRESFEHTITVVKRPEGSFIV